MTINTSEGIAGDAIRLIPAHILHSYIWLRAETSEDQVNDHAHLGESIELHGPRRLTAGIFLY